MSNSVQLTFAGDTKSLDAATDKAKKDLDKVGTAFHDSAGKAQEAGGKLKEAGEKIEGQTKNIRGGKDAIDGISTSLGALGVNIPGPVGGILAFSGGMADMADGIGGTVLPMLQKLWAVIMANPLIAIAALVIALGVGLYELYKHCETFRNAVKALWDMVKTAFDGIKRAIEVAWNWVKDHWQLLLAILLGPIGLAVAGILKYRDQIIGFFKAVPGKIKDVLSGLKDAVLGIFGDVGSWLKDAGLNLIKGFIGGIGDMFGSVKDKLGSLTDKLTSWKGPPAKDATLLRKSGQLIIQGLIDGFNDMTPAVKAVLNGLTDTVQAQLQKVAASITSAKSIATGVAASFGAKLMSGDVLGQLQKQLEDTQALQRDLALLSKQGLHKSLLDQLTAGGLGSLDAANALAMGGKGAIGQANSLDSQLNAAGQSIGGAEALRDTGVQLTANLTTVLKVDGRTLADIVHTELLKKKKTSGALGLS